MLEMRPNCECCNSDLPPTVEAFICSFECTFCADCAGNKLSHRCPNCGGELAMRPRRTGDNLTTHPANITRIFNPEGCP